MVQVRWAEEGEVERQKKLWKLCFGDPVSYTDFYFANRYKEDETLVLLQSGRIIAMLTLFPVRTVFPDNQSFATSMLYAIATHPEYQHEGYGSQLIDSCHKYQVENDIAYSVLVPAGQDLMNFYHNHGYQEIFYMREVFLSCDILDRLQASEEQLCKISPLDAQEYNARRNDQLKGKFHIAYPIEDIEYQKKLSRQSGADIYDISVKGFNGYEETGCAVIERISSEKVLIKELLISEEFLHLVIKEIVKQITAKEYILRIPAYLGENLGGSVRPFGMIKDHKHCGPEIKVEDQGYLGIAFD